MNHLNLNKIVFVACCAAVSVSAAQADLLVNGGFETGNLSGWNVPNSNWLGVSTGSAFAHSGTYGLDWGPVGQQLYIDQDIATVVGAKYDLSFWYRINYGPTNEISALVDNTTVFDAFDPPADATWTMESVAFTATSTSTNIKFGFRQDPGYSGFDDASVVQTSAATPAPAAILPFITGLIGYSRRRRSAK